MKKIFVVGCPRSGTTLVQKLLGIRSDVYTCKETHYFQKIRRVGKGKVLDYLAVSPENVLEAYEYIRQHNQLLLEHDPSAVRSRRSAVVFFDRLMTQEAKARSKPVWVEKTPAHVFHIRWIRHYIPAAQFVHVIRDGRDVVASLVDAARQFPQAAAWKKYADLETAIAEYNRSLQTSLGYLREAKHLFVQYEHILDDSAKVCRRLYSLLGLVDEDLLSDLSVIHRDVVRSDEIWKGAPDGMIQDTRFAKFDQIFDELQKELITREVRSPSPEQRAQFV